MNGPDEESDAVFQMNFQFNSRHRKERLPKSASQLVSQLIARTGFTQELSHNEVGNAWQGAVEAVASRFRDKTRANAVRRGVLSVTVENSTALQQITFDKQKLLEAIRRIIPHAEIRDIRFRAGPMENPS
jgi:predicted nucleic acid-binding Zn ribbon protein